MTTGYNGKFVLVGEISAAEAALSLLLLGMGFVVGKKSRPLKIRDSKIGPKNSTMQIVVLRLRLRVD